jgi:hypothetical protein
VPGPVLGEADGTGRGRGPGGRLPARARALDRVVGSGRLCPMRGRCANGAGYGSHGTAGAKAWRESVDEGGGGDDRPVAIRRPKPRRARPSLRRGRAGQ